MIFISFGRKRNDALKKEWRQPFSERKKGTVRFRGGGCMCPGTLGGDVYWEGGKPRRACENRLKRGGKGGVGELQIM